MTANGREEIVAVVSPRSVGGTSLFETTDSITKENVQEFYSEDAVIQATCSALRQRGFRILQVSPTTISIAGTPDLFREVFGAEVRKQRQEIMPGFEREVFNVTEETSHQVLQAPPDLSDLIEGVTIPTPPILFASPLPPLVQPDPSAYRYLLVPNEVALISRAARVHRNGTTGRGIRVAMVDSGFYRHPFYNRYGFRASATVLGPGAVDPDQDMDGHGTGEAANVFANAPDVELIPIKFSDDIVGSFNAAIAQKPHIITNSWGFSVDLASWDEIKQQDANLYAALKALEAAIADAVSQGIVVCFSAGNGHYGFPGSHPDVISVGGVHVNFPEMTLEASSYASSFNSKLYPGRSVPDVCGLVGRNTPVGAPSIMLPVQPGSSLDLANTGAEDDGWGLFSGTSAACPQIAGIVALLLQKDPTLTPAKVKEILKKSAIDVQAGQTAMGDTAAPGNDLATGSGLADAKWAWISTLGDVIVQFLDSPPEKQLEMHEAGLVPKIKQEFIDDLISTLRSR